MLISATKNSYNSKRIRILIFILVFFFTSISLSILMIKNPYAAIIFSISPIFFYIFYINPLHGLSILILLIPFGGTEALNLNILGVVGAKPLPLISFFLILVSFMNFKNIQIPPKHYLYLLLFIVLIFTASFIRSVSNLNYFNYLQNERLTVGRYILSFYIKPLIYFLPCVVIVFFCNTKAQIEYIIKAILLSMLLLSSLVIFIYVFRCHDKTNIGEIRDTMGLFFGIHTNGLANFFIIATPLLIVFSFNRNILFSAFLIIVPAIAIGLLYSRSAYFLFIISIIMVLILTGKATFLPLIMLAFLFLFSFISSSIISRATVGFDSMNIDQIFSGRIEHLWIPLFDEYINNVKYIFIGGGRYFIQSSDASINGIILPATHPHNMYIEQLLDAGIIGLLVFLIFYYKLLSRSLKNYYKIQKLQTKHYYAAIIVSIFCYLFSGITDRTFFPSPNNGYLWIILGLLISFDKLYLRHSHQIND